VDQQKLSACATVPTHIGVPPPVWNNPFRRYAAIAADMFDVSESNLFENIQIGK
jgi:hypothetical protein